MNIGSICVKIAGRDAGKKCVIVEKKDNLVLIDGETRRRKINQAHLVPTGEKIELQSGDHEEVKAAFKQMGIEIIDTKPKPKTEKPKKSRKSDLKKRAVKKVTKKVVKKAPKKEEPKKEAPVEKTE
jgi:large subunit ribosomal protein L14e